MKRANNLFRKICSMDNIYRAHHNAKKGKSKYKEVIKYEKDKHGHTLAIHKMLITKQWKPSPLVKFKLMCQGKEREITKTSYFPDRVIHHAIMQVVEPIFRTVFIKDTYQSIKGKGVHKAVKRVKGWMSDEHNTKYALKMDIKKFYPSLKGHVIKKYYRKKIKCKDTLVLLDRLVDASDGLPIGYYTSQTIGNFVLSYLDHFAKHNGAKFYIRYADDIVIFSHDKAFLHGMRKKVEQFLNEELELNLKENWQVFDVRKKGLDFLGYRFFGKYILIRKRIAKSMKKAFMKKHTAKGDISMLMSYLGWAKYANSQHLINALLPLVKHAASVICRYEGMKNPILNVQMTAPRQRNMQLRLF